MREREREGRAAGSRAEERGQHGKLVWKMKTTKMKIGSIFFERCLCLWPWPWPFSFVD
jgi:hypothetical protein